VAPPRAYDRGMSTFSRGFHGRRRPDVDPSRVPPGQYVTEDFPVLSAGPTPHPDLSTWSFAVDGAVDASATWTWEQLNALPQETFTVDIHCVKKWSKLGTTWTGVSVDTLLDGVETEAEHVSVWADGGYTTNLPLEDLRDGKAWVVHTYDGEPLEPAHGGPARLLVPHLYFWKSAKWVRGLTLTIDDEPGFWEAAGYHNYGDPWREQRYWSD
jgi:DMSO/TMAO reductase YedYZ molybdopterin-dependent catalytic subunit